MSGRGATMFDTERDGWTRIGTLGWRKSLRGKHWAQVGRSALGWSWTIHRADPITMCPVVVADGEDVSLRAVKEDVDDWNDHYHQHAVVVRSGHWPRKWGYWCRVCEVGRDLSDSLVKAIEFASQVHRECEAAWQRGER